MRIRAMLLTLSVMASQALPQEAGIGPIDPLLLPRLKSFAAFRASSNNPDPESNDDSRRPIPGETVVLADLEGPGVVTHIWLTVADSEYGWPRLLRLRVYYDGSPVPSVDCPIGDFFAVGHGFERAVNSLMIRDGSSGRSRNSYWPMPFRRSCRITVTNEGRRRTSNLYYHVDWHKLTSLPPDTAYFHARYRQELPAAPGKRYEILQVRGQGHYVGTVLSVIQTQTGWFGEGDEFFFVDGREKASIEGTGTEDYFNDAWSLRVADAPFTGVPVAEGTGIGSRMTAYRWHLTDPVPFRSSLRLEIEHTGWTYNADGSVRSASEERPDLFSSVAFWYQMGIARGLQEPPYGAARLPHGNARQIEVERSAGEVRADGGAVEVQKEVFWSKDLLLFRAQGPGARVTIPFEVDRDGDYEVIAQLAHSPDYGNYGALIDGTPARPDQDLEHEPGANTGLGEGMSLYFTETYVAEDHLLAWRRLGKGRHEVTFVCTGKDMRSSGYLLGIDTLVLARLATAGTPAAPETERAREMRRIGYLSSEGLAEMDQLRRALADGPEAMREAAAWSLTQLGSGLAPAVSELTRALSDPDPVVRGLSALALRNLGPGAKPALEVLVGRLRDEDENVRMASASALAALGADAAPAVSALIDACRVSGEHVHVLRSLADALGAIGPRAEAALPALRELERMPRVRWNAKAAIRRIAGTNRQQ